MFTPAAPGKSYPNGKFFLRLMHFKQRTAGHDSQPGSADNPAKRRRIKLPIIQSHSGRKIDLTNFDFDELLG